MRLQSSIVISLLFVVLSVSGKCNRNSGTTFLGRTPRNNPQRRHPSFLVKRGGATIAELKEDEDEDEYEEEEDEEEDEEESDDEIELDPKLTKSTMKAITKMKKKKLSATKKVLSSKLKAPKRKRRGSLFKNIPYIIRASLNPVTLLAMTRAYFASLFDLNFLKKDETQDLRSAMEEKAKKNPSGGRKKKRQFKPGQAKTLSDLPQLSA